MLLKDFVKGLPEIAPPPAPITDVPAVKLDNPGNVALARAYLLDRVAKGDVAIAGRGGNNRTYELAAHLRDLGLTQTVTRALIGELWNSKCLPPWSEPELDDIVNHAFLYAQNIEAAKARPTGAEAFKHVALPNAEPEAEDAEPAPSVPGARYVAQRWDTFHKIKPLAYLFRRVLPALGTGILDGAPSAGKTFIALEFAACAVTGLPAFGDDRLIPTSTGCAIYATAEGAYSLKAQRVRGWLQQHKDINPASPFFVISNLPPCGSADELIAFTKVIEAAVGNKPVKIIILDTLARMLGSLDENNATAMSQLMSAAENLSKRFSCLVLIIHHTRKDGGSDLKDIRGSGAISGALDVALHAERNNGGKGTQTKLTIQKMRDGPEDFELFLQGSNFSVGKDEVGEPSYSLKLSVISQREYFSKNVTVNPAAEREELIAAMDRLGLHSRDAALDYNDFAKMLAGNPSGRDPEDVAEAIGKWKSVLDSGSRERIGRKGGKTVAPKFAGLFLLDHRSGKPIKKWWIPPPEDIEGRTERGIVAKSEPNPDDELPFEGDQSKTAEQW